METSTWKYLQMKLNKSLISLAVLVMLLATACSQARYGSLTRRTKATHLTESKAEKQSKPKTIKSVNGKKAIAQQEVKAESNGIEVAEIESVQTEVFTSRIEKSKKDDLAHYMPNDDKNNKIEKESASHRVLTHVPVIAGKRLVKKLNKIADKTDMEKTQDDLVRILLIVLLVLIILALLPVLGEVIRMLIGLLVLILLIWLLLQLL